MMALPAISHLQSGSIRSDKAFEDLKDKLTLPLKNFATINPRKTPIAIEIGVGSLLSWPKTEAPLFRMMHGELPVH